MNTTQAQQKALDNALVTPGGRLEFEKGNMRLKTDIKPKEATFQVALGALALTSFYQAFLITAEKVSLDVDTFREILQIYLKIPSQGFEDLLLEHEILSFIRDLRHTRDIHYLTDHLTSQAMLESKAYKTYYAYASKEKTPKPNKCGYFDKKKQPTKIPKTKGLPVLSEVALTEAEQLKLATKRSKTQFYSSHASGSGDGPDTQSKVTDEQQHKVYSTNEGAGVRPKVPDVPQYDSESDEKSWTFSQDEEDVDEETDVNDDSEETESDNDRDDLTHPNLSTYKADDKEEEEEKTNDEEMSSNQRVSTPPEYELTEEEKENKEGDDEDMEGEQVQDEEDDMYKDMNINLEKSDDEMTDAQANQDIKYSHVTLTHVPLVAQQKISSVSSDLVSKFINPSLDTGIDSILNPNIQSHTLVNVPVSVAIETPSSDTIISQPPIPNIQPLQQTPGSITTTTIPTMTLPEIPNFASLFQFDQRVSALETKMSEFKQTNQFTKAISSVLGIVDNYIASKIKEAMDVAIQLQTNKLKEEAQAEN
nr:hypothetical protein [Tanacetum cinerariifolium]